MECSTETFELRSLHSWSLIEIWCSSLFGLIHYECNHAYQKQYPPSYIHNAQSIQTKSMYSNPGGHIFEECLLKFTGGAKFAD
ncbi:hypothetical protein V1477_006535 [Vespula maculifrons]|uniref:Uncharacterized protein n=1 Tax=Vespula maculifrons TaxID=7453 RepID=A0ABD2CJ45_VESMC